MRSCKRKHLCVSLVAGFRNGSCSYSKTFSGGIALLLSLTLMRQYRKTISGFFVTFARSDVQFLAKMWDNTPCVLCVKLVSCIVTNQNMISFVWWSCWVRNAAQCNTMFRWNRCTLKHFYIDFEWNLVVNINKSCVCFVFSFRFASVTFTTVYRYLLSEDNDGFLKVETGWSASQYELFL